MKSGRTRFEEKVNMATRQRNPGKPKLEVVPRTPLSVGRTDTHGNVVYSGILLSLPDDEYDALLPHLEFIEFRLHQRLHRTDLNMDTSLILD